MDQLEQKLEHLMALQGSLANFAGGVLILLFKPFTAGDVIGAQGYTACVQEIQIFNTILVTMDNQRVIIPNGLLSSGCVKNLFTAPTRRVDLTFDREDITMPLPQRDVHFFPAPE